MKVAMVLLVYATICHAAEFDPVDKLPNPVGFEKRVLLIDHLKDTYGLTTAGREYRQIEALYHTILKGEHEFGPRGIDIEISKEFVLKRTAMVGPVRKGPAGGKQTFTQHDMNLLQLEKEFKVTLPADADASQVSTLLAELIEKRAAHEGQTAPTPQVAGVQPSPVRPAVPDNRNASRSANGVVNATPTAKERIEAMHKTHNYVGGMAMRCRVYYREKDNDRDLIEVYLVNVDEENTYRITSGYVRFADGQAGVLCVVKPGCPCGNAREHPVPRVIAPLQIVWLGDVRRTGAVSIYDMTAEPTRR